MHSWLDADPELILHCQDRSNLEENLEKFRPQLNKIWLSCVDKKRKLREFILSDNIKGNFL